jgi:hypothetical protein
MAAKNNSISLIVKELEAQEKDLQSQLDKISKAKALLTDSEAPVAKRRGRPARKGAKRGPKKGSKRGPKAGAKTLSKSVAKPTAKKGRPAVKRGRKKGRVTYIDNIKEVLTNAGGSMSPNDILKRLFDKDPSKDFKTFSRNIYPVFSRSYKNKSLLKKGGKIHLPKK